MTYTLPTINYQYDALEPYIDEKTMKIHHLNHHNTYIDNLNKILKPIENINKYNSINNICSDLDQFPKNAQLLIRNNAGGHLNHSMFWKLLSPNKINNSINEPILKLIDNNFINFDNFKEQFTQAAMSRFGSGWVWLCIDQNQILSIFSTPNQDNPYMKDYIHNNKFLRPLIALDLWEHAYYLKYQNKRIEYINIFWHILNWKQVEINYHLAIDSFTNK